MSIIGGLNNEKKQFEVVTNLDRAAFLILQGAELVGFEGKYWKTCKIVLMVTKEILDTTHDKRVFYDKYMKVRKKIKARMYLLYNPYVK